MPVLNSPGTIYQNLLKSEEEIKELKQTDSSDDLYFSGVKLRESIMYLEAYGREIKRKLKIQQGSQ